MSDYIKDLFQNLIAPQLEAIKGEIHAVEAKTGSTDPNFADRYRELAAKIEDLRRDFHNLSADIARLDQKLDIFSASLTDKLLVLRRDLLARIKAVK